MCDNPTEQQKQWFFFVGAFSTVVSTALICCVCCRRLRRRQPEVLIYDTGVRPGELDDFTQTFTSATNV